MRHASIDYSNLDTVEEDKSKPIGKESALSERKLDIQVQTKPKPQVNEIAQTDKKFDLSKRIQAKDHPALMGKKAAVVSS